MSNRKPPFGPMEFVNLHGEPLGGPADLRRRLGSPGGARPQAAAPADETPAAPASAATVEAVFDALCIAGSARGRTWILHFLRGLEARNERGAYYSAAEVGAALQQLRGAGRITSDEGIGFSAPPAALLARLPDLMSGADAPRYWRVWVWAAGGGQTRIENEPWPPPLRSSAEMLALARLVLYAGFDIDGYNRVARQVLGPAGTPEMLARALTTPFMPILFERIDPALRWGLLQALDRVHGATAPAWQPVLQWLDEHASAALHEVPPALRITLAERRLYRGDMAGVDAALAGLEAPVVSLIQATQLVWAGRWAEAADRFAASWKAAQKSLSMRRGLASASVSQLYVLALLAQPQAAAWTTARKFCLSESGSRKPSPFDGWGLWAHAIAVKLGDETLEPAAFIHMPPNHYGGFDVESNADRLLLAAWLGHTPEGWTDVQLALTVHTLHATGLHWQADLARQSAARLSLAMPARQDGDGPVWPVAYFGAPREAWRDALAAIEALGSTRPAEASTAPATLQWRLTLDSVGRVIEVEPFERGAGVRGPGKPKPVTLARVKKSQRLDARDAAVARCIAQAGYSAQQLGIDVAGAAMALVDHPGLVFADAPEQLVELREALPELEVRRQRGADGGESFVFTLIDPLLSGQPVRLGERWPGIDPDAEAERRNSVRVVRESAERARLIRITPAQRRVAELVSQHWAVPVDAKAELEAALQVLAGHFQLHSDAAAGQPVACDSRLRAQFSPLGDGLQLRLLVRPFGSFGPTLMPGSGRARLLTLREGLSLSTERELDVETAHLQAVLDALPFLADSDGGDASWLLDDPEQALAAVQLLPTLPAVAGLDWPRGKPVRVTTPPAGALQVAVSSGRDWFAVAGELRLDEHRVLGLQQLMALARESRHGRFVALGEGEYLALTERLRQQLADLDALAQTDKDVLRLPAAAAAWLAETLDGSETQGDKPWARRLALLDEAAALTPQPPAALQAELRAYQAEGYAWMVRLAHAGLGACLADDMGLGKTVQTLALLLTRAELGPALVIAPTSVCGNWVAEAQRFAPSLRVVLYGEGERADALAGAGPGDLMIASYALAQIDVEAFAAREWATLVLDEAQALKNAATKRAKSVATLQAGFRLALTGTPVENRLADLWSIMNLLNPGLLGSAGQFNERFAGAIERQRDDGARARLRRLVAPFLLRRTKAQVLTDLPPRTEIVHRIEPGPEERAFLEASRRSAIERVAALGSEGAESQAAFHVLAELTRLRRAACDPRLVAPELGIVGAKAQEFEQLAVELVAGRHKALVFSQFTDFLKLLAERLDSAGITYQYLDGSTPSAERTRRVAAFQRGEGDLFLISLKAGGFGLNLTAADYVIIVDPWWNPAAEDQAMGRAHRIGQQRPVTVYRLVTAGSVEERIVELHRDKRVLADGILEGQDDAAPLRAADLRELLG